MSCPKKKKSDRGLSKRRKWLTQGILMIWKGETYVYFFWPIKYLHIYLFLLVNDSFIVFSLKVNIASFNIYERNLYIFKRNY